MRKVCRICVDWCDNDPVEFKERCNTCGSSEFMWTLKDIAQQIKDNTIAIAAIKGELGL